MFHVLVGTNDADATTIRASANSNKRMIRDWAAPKSASIGDEVVLFTHSAGFLASATIASAPQRGRFQNRPVFRCDLRNVTFLPSPVPLPVVAERMPEWGWVRQQSKGYTTPPEHVADQLSRLIRSHKSVKKPTGTSETLEAMEGIVRETKVLSRGRSAALRRAALGDASGTCEVCETVFSTIASGLGLHALQVHHRMQLSLTDIPRVTKLEDLAVVCANCHAMIHADPRHAMSVEELKDMLAP